MKTANDIYVLIPVLADLLRQSPHSIGQSTYEFTEDGWSREDRPEANTLSYDRDGWEVEVDYECTALWESDGGDRDTPPSVEINRAWGEVTDISVCRYDETTGETVEYGYGELRPLWTALDETLSEI